MLIPLERLGTGMCGIAKTKSMTKRNSSIQRREFILFFAAKEMQVPR